jgi:hypothetical protein
MSAVRPSPPTPGALLCPRCGSALHDDQAWCLECGLAARTRVHPPPSWRLPILATCVALALLVAGIAFALVALLDEPEPTPAPATVTVPAATTPAPPTPTVPQVTTPTTTPTVPTTTAPAPAGPGTTTPTHTTPQRTFTVPGVGLQLPANG